MVKRTKAFDCVEMKNCIQAEMLAEEKQVGEEEMARRREAWLKSSDDPLAVWWRNIGSAKKPPKQPG
jgi:hypothetical protein